jgi:mannose-1-phosphate guanylyltransferase/mannose-6-phosphate isomerase
VSAVQAAPGGRALVPVILAGGSGTRLWPLSREGFPKQLLNLSGDRSLLQDTVLRVDGIEREAGAQALRVQLPMVVCGEEMRFLVLGQIEALRRHAGSVLLEPVGRNTAPALTCAALDAIEAHGDALLLVMPADHLIADTAAFRRAVVAGVQCLARDARAIVTFGITPERAETGYGYIRMDAAANGHEARAVAAFVEKPDAATARGYLAGGEHLWNSGLFLVGAQTWLDFIEALRPEMLARCRDALAAGRHDGAFRRLDAAAFAACPSDSIDYAVMEPLTAGANSAVGRAFVIPVSMGWSDVGSFEALLQVGEPDASGNVKHGDVLAQDSARNLFVAGDRLLAAIGVQDLVVVSTPDAVLVASRERSQDVRGIVKALNEAGRAEGRSHRRVYRPWGSYEPLDAGGRYQVKRLTVAPGAQLSLQMHHHRAEHWVVVRGTARVTRGEEEFLLTENQSTYIPLGTTHRLENPGQVELEVIEVQSGSYLGEDDIVRFEDRYDRVPAAK